jgi:hypothetical protein
MTKEEANTKEERSPVPPTAVKRKSEVFQSPIATPQEKPDKKNYSSFTRIGNPPESSSYIMTPGYENSSRNIEQMNHNMYILNISIFYGFFI